MRNKIIRALLLAVNLLFCLSGSIFAADEVDLNQLVENANTMDGQIVTVSGEAIGEVLERGDYAWVNINDGTNAMGIWMTLDEAQSIGVFGNYKHTGDQIQVTGIFNRACVEHGGDIDIHCQKLEILKPGFSTPEQVSNKLILVALVLSGLAICFSLLFWYWIGKK